MGAGALHHCLVVDRGHCGCLFRVCAACYKDISRHVGIFCWWRGGMGLRWGMPVHPLVSTLVEAHGVDTEILAVHRHDRPMQFHVPLHFTLDEVHWEPPGACMHPHFPLDVAISARRVTKFFTHNWATNPPSSSHGAWPKVAP